MLFLFPFNVCNAKEIEPYFWCTAPLLLLLLELETSSSTTIFSSYLCQPSTLYSLCQTRSTSSIFDCDVRKGTHIVLEGVRELVLVQFPFSWQEGGSIEVRVSRRNVSLFNFRSLHFEMGTCLKKKSDVFLV